MSQQTGVKGQADWETIVNNNAEDAEDRLQQLELLSNRLGGGLVINGNFDVWQRGTSFSSLGSNEYFADRFKSIGVGGTFDVSREPTDGSEPFNSAYYARFIISSSNTNLNQLIENQANIIKNKKTTISFWVKGSISGSAKVILRNDTKAISLGSEVYNITTDWTKVEITFNESSQWDANDVILIYFASTYSSVMTVDYAQIKFEVSPVATPFLPKKYSEELRDCQRYYWTSDGFVQSVATETFIFFPEFMRIIPSVSVDNGSVSFIRKSHFRWSGSTISTTISADAEMI